MIATVVQLHTFHLNKYLVAEFNQQSVHFLVVGGLAVQFYIPARTANDLDLLVEQTPENVGRIWQAFRLVGISPVFCKKDLLQPK